jgi:hypothetical protein
MPPGSISSSASTSSSSPLFNSTNPTMAEIFGVSKVFVVVRF